MTNESSYMSILDYWYPQVDKEIANACFYLIGNKSDKVSEKKVSFDKAQNFAEINGFLFDEVSLKENINVSQILQKFVEKIIIGKYFDPTLDNIDLQKNSSNKSKGCSC